MKHLFIARHGDYGDDSRLNDYGRQQMEALGKAIKDVLNGGSAYIISSPKQRAIDSSQILAAQLALPPEFEKNARLYVGFPGNGIVNLEELMKLVNNRRERAEGLIIVTHSEIVDIFSYYFADKELDQDRGIDEIPKGKAVHFNLEQRTYQILPK